MGFALITEIKNILEQASDLFEFVYWNTSKEITGYPALVSDVIVKEYEKQVHYQQFYDTGLKLGIYILMPFGTDDAEFETLIDATLNRFINAKDTDGNSYIGIVINNTSVGHFEISGKKIVGFFVEMDFRRKEFTQ